MVMVVAQHFLLSRQAKTLSLASVFRMTDAEAETTFRTIRWPDTQGEPVCPECGGVDTWDCRSGNGCLRFRCSACRKSFSITSGTLFAPARCRCAAYLAAIAIFANEVKGKSMLALSRDLGVSYKAAFVLAHKLRETMGIELKGRTIGGEGKTAEIDGGYFGGYVKPANIKENRKDRRFLENQSGKRKVVGVIRERSGNSVPGVFKSESQALSFIRSRVAKGAVINADESGAWNDLHSRYEMARINHLEAYSADGACTNWAELFFSRMRRGEIGHHHMWLARIFSATRKRPLGARTTGACRMASKSTALLGWPCRTNYLWISPATGSGTFGIDSGLRRSSTPARAWEESLVDWRMVSSHQAHSLVCGRNCRPHSSHFRIIPG
jgi:hypothetical protein